MSLRNPLTRWNDEMSYSFMVLYKEQENLWNIMDPDYTNRLARVASFEYILRKMNVPNFSVKDVPKKIKNFRSTYYQELQKIQRSQILGEIYKPTLKWFNIMDYIVKSSKHVDRETSKLMVSVKVKYVDPTLFKM